MSDLNEVQASGSTKIAGANPATGVEDNFLEVDTHGSAKVNLRDAAGTSIASANDVSGANNLLVTMTHNIYVSLANSSIANLAAGATFTGTSELNLNATTIQTNIKCDQPTTVTVYQSNDNVNFDFVDTFYLLADQNDSRVFLAAGSYTKVSVKNNGTATTTYLNLQTIFVPIQSVLPRTLTHEGQLKVSIEEVSSNLGNILTADRDLFGASINGTRIKRLTGDFSLPLNNNDISTTVTGGAPAVAVTNSMAVLQTGTATTASSKLFTNQSNKHYSGRESYAQFSAVFTAPTNANSDQRAGIYDANNGFFIGYHGLIFGITVRKNAVDTFTPITSFNEDLLNGNPNSKYLRNDIPEAVDFTKLNKYRIRFGFGSAFAQFEVLSPDDAWVEFHEVNGVNINTTPGILNPTLPMTFEVVKSSSDATDLILSIPAFDAGTVENPNAYGPEEINGRKYVTANVAQQTASATVYTVSTGRTLRVTTLDISCANALLSGNGQLDIRDGSSGTVLYSMTIPSSTNQSSGGNNKTITFPVPLRFANSVYAHEVSGTLTFSVFFVGYESE